MNLLRANEFFGKACRELIEAERNGKPEEVLQQLRENKRIADENLRRHEEDWGL